MVTRVRRIDIYVHWTVLFIAAIVLLGAARDPLPAITALIAYLGVLAIHEAGHLIMAHRLGYDTFSIELYPIFGLARMEAANSRFDRAAVAWGGVLAQAAVAVPVLLYLGIAGYPKAGALNPPLAILGDFSLGIAALNLLPVGPLDGSAARTIVPAYFERRARRNRRPIPYRSTR